MSGLHILSELTADLWLVGSPVFVVANVLLIASPPALTLAQVCCHALGSRDHTDELSLDR